MTTQEQELRRTEYRVNKLRAVLGLDLSGLELLAWLEFLRDTDYCMRYATRLNGSNLGGSD